MLNSLLSWLEQVSQIGSAESVCVSIILRDCRSFSVGLVSARVVVGSRAVVLRARVD